MFSKSSCIFGYQMARLEDTESASMSASLRDNIWLAKISEADSLSSLIHGILRF
jgi:hypothetical protein